jgi:hypothetical protein
MLSLMTTEKTASNIGLFSYSFLTFIWHTKQCLVAQEEEQALYMALPYYRENNEAVVRSPTCDYFCVFACHMRKEEV